MPQNFLSCDREQELLLPPSLREWLPEDHLAWFIVDAVAQFDLAGFYAAYRADGHGRAAHDPSMMLALLLYAYSVGVRSSRVIERRCVEDVAFRVIAANQVPDHTTIARFRQRHQQALADLFGDVLALCAEAGLVRVGVVAVDGTKLHASASKFAARSYEQIVEEILAEAMATDAAEDEQFGEDRGDELPGDLRSRQGRRGWLREAKQRLEERRANEARPIPKSRPDRLLEAKRRLEEEHRTELQANADYEAYRARGIRHDGGKLGRGPTAFKPPEAPAGSINLTDLDSRRIRSPKGPAQAYNCQAVCTEDQIVLAAELTTASPDFGLLEPMLQAARRELTRARVEQAAEIVLADAGYWHGEQMDRIAATGTIVLAPPDASTRRGARPGWDGGRYAFLRSVLATDQGRELYAKRQGMIEPVFGNTKFNRGYDRFSRRGRAACRSEWRLITATHNLLKLHRASLPAPA